MSVSRGKNSVFFTRVYADYTVIQRSDGRGAQPPVTDPPSSGESMIERATRLHRYYFSPSPAPATEPLTPDTISSLQVCQIRMLLRQLLPEELVDPILDYAQVYTVSGCSRQQRVVFDDQRGSVWSIADRQARERHWIYLASNRIFGRLPRAPIATEDEDDSDTLEAEAEEMPQQEEEEEEVPEDPGARNPWKVKSIKVKFESRDQGWTSEHYEGDGKFDLTLNLLASRSVPI